MTKIYIAAPWVNRADALVAQEQFEAAGFEVTSHWIRMHSDLDYDTLPQSELAQEFSAQAVEDIEDIRKSDVFVILNLCKSEGKATELGVAYTLGLPIILVGECSRNIFYRLPGIFQAESVEAAIDGIRANVETVQ